MKIKRSTQLKAAFLMIVFSFNTIIGFACAVGIDMGFNTPHHHDEEASEALVHIHADGKKHVHHAGANHHDEQDNDHHNSKEDKDNCCNKKVIQFNDVDKSASHSLNANIAPPYFTTFITAFYITRILYFSSINTDIKYFVRSHHPPIPDIRIAIRSFQI